MRKVNQTIQERFTDEDKMALEYDFSNGVRGKHYQAYRQGHRVIIHKTDGTTFVEEFFLPEGAVLLDPDVGAYFPNSETVNKVLRGLIALIPQQPALSEAVP
ncbi:MAG: hypothetical protein U0350_18045 [Caldilineaceae bacterium]